MKIKPNFAVRSWTVVVLQEVVTQKAAERGVGYLNCCNAPFLRLGIHYMGV